MSQNKTSATFSIRVKVQRAVPEMLWRQARVCEQILRDEAPAGVEILGVELVTRGPQRAVLMRASRHPSAQPDRLPARTHTRDLEPVPAPEPSFVPREEPPVGHHGYLTWLEQQNDHLTTAELLQKAAEHLLARAEWLERRKPPHEVSLREQLVENLGRLPWIEDAE